MKVVIIGAGQTGRGFIAPFIQQSNHEITFIDRDKNLIQRLRSNTKYLVKYFDALQPAVEINHFGAYQNDAPEAARVISDADLVTISVFSDNIKNLVPLLKKGIAKRKKEKKLMIVCIENGINVKQPLLDAGLDAHISEGVIFCTSVQSTANLDITSQKYPNLPVDGSVDGIDFKIEGMPLVYDFPFLIKRKIYTYNLMSAVIAYLGSYLGYEIYAEAANDRRIMYAIDQINGTLNQVLSDKYLVSLKEQTEFANLAVEKFQNKFITDTILRNAQQASRKLNANERIITPIQFAIERGFSTKYFSVIAAAALHYGFTKEDLDVESEIDKMKSAIQQDRAIDEILFFYSLFKQEKELTDIFRNVDTY